MHTHTPFTDLIDALTVVDYERMQTAVAEILRERREAAEQQRAENARKQPSNRGKRRRR